MPYSEHDPNYELMDDEEEQPWSCPYCGEEGGEPLTKSWREFQGDAYHGGVVEFQEECCSKCYNRA